MARNPKFARANDKLALSKGHKEISVATRALTTTQNLGKQIKRVEKPSSSYPPASSLLLSIDYFWLAKDEF